MCRYTDEQVFDSGHHSCWTITPGYGGRFQTARLRCGSSASGAIHIMRRVPLAGPQQGSWLQGRDDSVDKSLEIVGRFIE